MGTNFNAPHNSNGLSYPELSSFEYFIFVISKFTSYPYIQEPMFSLVPD